jgi:hypothetical protein
MQNDVTTALQHYHAHFDNVRYLAIAEFIAANLYADRTDARVVNLLISTQNAALELCGHPHHSGAGHTLAVHCGNHFLSLHTIDAMRDFLHLFKEDDARIDDFELTAKAILKAYSGLDDIKTAVAHANGVHGWRGRMAYDFLAASAALVVASSQLLMEGELSYIHEKLQSSFQLLIGALHEGVRGCDNPSWFDFKTVRFPDEHGR